MKAFVVTILVPDEWSKNDVIVSCNIGIRKYAEESERELKGTDYHTMCHEELKLRREG
jgi:hypothetical protein